MTGTTGCKSGFSEGCSLKDGSLCVPPPSPCIPPQCSQPSISQVSFDYTLIAPDTAYQIIKDVQDGIEFVAERLNRRLEKEETAVRIDPSKIVASGASGGGTVAYYAVRLNVSLCSP